MDQQLNDINLPVPPDAPLDMPTQNLKEAPIRAPIKTVWRTHIARIIVFGGAFIIGSYGTWQMQVAMGNRPHTLLQWLLLFLFSLTFYWVAFSTTGALAGLLPRGGR